MNRKVFYTITVGGIILILVMVLLMLWYAARPQKKKQPSTKPVNTESIATGQNSSIESMANITIKDLTLKELEKKKDIEVIVNAKECKFLQFSDTVECSQVTCTLLDHKIPSAQITTNKALINRKNKNIFFAGVVQGTMKNLAITGADINYDFAQQILQTNQNALYTHPDFKISSQKSFIDIKNNRIEFSGGVINEFKVHDKQQ